MSEDLSVRVFISHDGHSSLHLLRYPHEIRKRHFFGYDGNVTNASLIQSNR